MSVQELLAPFFLQGASLLKNGTPEQDVLSTIVGTHVSFLPCRSNLWGNAAAGGF